MLSKSGGFQKNEPTSLASLSAVIISHPYPTWSFTKAFQQSHGSAKPHTCLFLHTFPPISSLGRVTLSLPKLAIEIPRFPYQLPNFWQTVTGFRDLWSYISYFYLLLFFSSTRAVEVEINHEPLQCHFILPSSMGSWILGNAWLHFVINYQGRLGTEISSCKIQSQSSGFHLHNIRNPRVHEPFFSLLPPKG